MTRLRIQQIVRSLRKTEDSSTQEAAAHEIFDYSTVPLGSATEIRLLSFPDLGSGDLLKCKLSTFDINKAPPFAALSYVWYNPRLKSSVSVPCGDGNQALSVLGNLYDALKHLVQQSTSAFRVSGLTYLWADAMCIDQSNLAERAAQVLLMRQLYQKAQSTYIWLGSDQSTAKAFSLLSDMAAARLKYMAAGDHRTFAELSDGDTSRYGMPSLADSRCSDLRSLLGTGWFTRTWVIQELAVSFNPLLVCSTEWFHWEVLDKVLQFAMEISDPLVSMAGLYQAHDLNHIRAKIQAGDSPDILELLSFGQRFDATDPRDKVFALVGLANSRYTAAQCLHPDYSKSAQDVFLATAFELLLFDYENYQDMALLRLSRKSSKQTMPNLPSWVPDWALGRKSMSVSDLINSNVSPNQDINEHDQQIRSTFKAAAESELPGEAQRPVLSPDGLRLRVFGYSIAQVTRTGPIYENVRGQGWLAALFVPQRLHAVLNEWVKMCVTDTTSNAKPADSADVLRNALTVGRLIHADDACGICAARRHDFDVWCRLRQRFLDLPAFSVLSPLRMLMVSWKTIGLTDSPGSQDAIGSYSRTWTFINTLLLGRRMFRTAEAEIGLGPPLCRKGDHIFVVAGCRVPLILRRAEGSGFWEYIGDCYVDGVMQGQQFRQQDCEELWLV